jgi:hypothetical protein
MVTTRLPIELSIEYFLRLAQITVLCVAFVLQFDYSCLQLDTHDLSTILYDLSDHLLMSHIWTLLSQVPRKFTSKVEGKMGYEDFVYFILAEEDKSSEPSLEYWYFVSY